MNPHHRLLTDEVPEGQRGPVACPGKRRGAVVELWWSWGFQGWREEDCLCTGPRPPALPATQPQFLLLSPQALDPHQGLNPSPGWFGQAGLESERLPGSQAWGNWGQTMEALRSHACQTPWHQACPRCPASEGGQWVEEHAPRFKVLQTSACKLRPGLCAFSNLRPCFKTSVTAHIGCVRAASQCCCESLMNINFILSGILPGLFYICPR